MNNNTLKLNMSEMEQVNGTGLIDWIIIKYNGPLVKTTYEKNIVNKAHCLIPEEAA